MMKKHKYIKPAAQVVPLATRQSILQASSDPIVPVNTEEEGNQEEADVKQQRHFGVHWDEVW